MKLPDRIHFVGIGGIGMSALATVLQEDGHRISGSDLSLGPLAKRLAARGAQLYEGHAAANIGDAQLVVVSAAIPADNPELEAARAAGIPIIKRGALLGQLMAGRRGIAVAGTHGKTTTSAMIAHILLEAGEDPTFLVGGVIRGLDTNARRGAGPWLVAEADEYDRSFLHLAPEIAVITNVEADHLDLYRDLAEIRAAFRQFARQVRSRLILCWDDPWLRGWHWEETGCAVDTYGLAGGTWRAEAITLEGSSSQFRLAGDHALTVRLAVPGRHNVQNALGALAATSAAGVAVETAAAALERFRGAKRRLEPVGEANGVLVIDDYSHHPTEIRVALAALRVAYPRRRIVCLHQPHTFSRTKLLLPEFATAFGEADLVRIADIYPARERDVWGIRAADLAAAIQHPDVRATGSVEESAAAVAAELRPGDVLALIGAGDISRAAGLVLERLTR
ncbi:MAG: UDP-N-acetylmuramate--L-alanine ligase [Chloroflexota bacterium]|nr:UDP-N-acetylmuramate--L-alanine ligase [Dehalococcoidia bacterium]MDW8253172.1 UDP-N-acetylmuramate--L-alanine ligase [Chloroflexota bacterium]